MAPEITTDTALFNRSLFSHRTNLSFIPATRLAPYGLAGCSTTVPWQSSTPLFQSPLGAPFGPSVCDVTVLPSWSGVFRHCSASIASPVSHRIRPLLTSPRWSAPITRYLAPMSRSVEEISRGKTRYLRCIDAGFTKCIPVAEGGLCGHVPTRPGCITPPIRFLFIAPPLWIELPSDPASRRRPCPSPCLRLCVNLAIGLAPMK